MNDHNPPRHTQYKLEVCLNLDICLLSGQDVVVVAVVETEEKLLN